MLGEKSKSGRRKDRTDIERYTTKSWEQFWASTVSKSNLRKTCVVKDGKCVA
jgi:hypothetical protein